MMCKAQEENKRIWQEEAESKGVQKGFANATRINAISCYENGLSIEMIAKGFNVTPDTVKEWIAEKAENSVEPLKP